MPSSEIYHQWNTLGTTTQSRIRMLPAAQMPLEHFPSLSSLKITTILTFMESISLLSLIVLPSLNIIFWFSWCFGLYINPYYSRSFSGSGFLHLTSCVWDSPILLNTRVSFFFAVSHSILEVYHYLCVHSTNDGISFKKKVKRHENTLIKIFTVNTNWRWNSENVNSRFISKTFTTFFFCSSQSQNQSGSQRK